MINKYITATILALVSSTGSVSAQGLTVTPRLVVNIAIDQLRTDYLESFEQLYGNHGFKRLLQNGVLYTNVRYPFSPVDRASALAAINTGTTPNYNGITAEQWFDVSSLRSVSCVDDDTFKGILTNENTSAQKVMTTTLSDELKIGTNGKSLVYSIAERRDAAVIPAGHNADGAYWVNPRENCWCTSTYYSKKSPKWLETYNLYNTPYKKNSSINEQITSIALECITANSIGKDNTTDMLFITYNASPSINKKGYEDCRETYVELDRNIEKIINGIQAYVGANNVLFVISGTGYYNELNTKEKNFRIPGGTVYINRTANLLNMYLGAMYGSDRYVEGYLNNNIYLNQKLIDKKRMNYDEMTKLAKTFVRQSEGISNAYSRDDIMSAYSEELSDVRRGYYNLRCGDIVIETTPGWNIVNEETQQNYYPNFGYLETPAIFYGYNLKHDRINKPVSAEALSATIAKAIQIRAPNACKVAPLF